MNPNQLIIEMEKTAKEMCIEIRKGEYEVSSSFIFKTQGMGETDRRELVGVLSAGVVAFINDELKDETLSNWLKSNYEFMAISGEETRQGTEIHVGFMKRTNLGLVKKLAKKENIVVGRGCAHCFKVSTNLLKCSGCKCVSYCCKEHQVADWKIEHKHECKKLALAKN